MLTLAATPIGNLDDISTRLATVLKETDYLFAEDTRQSRKLLTHLGIDRKMSSFHEHSDEVTLTYIGRLLAAGNKVAYISDGGMPAINDPGYELVRLALDQGFEVDVIPGPCAVINALVLSGLPSHAFAFLGFFPTRPERRRDILDKLSALEMTTLFYEAPSRITHTLAFLAEEIGETPMALCREMTKMHQEVLRGKPAEILENLTQVRGEMALVIGPVEQRKTEKSLLERYEELVAEGHAPSRCAKLLAGEFRTSKREVYKLINGES